MEDKFRIGVPDMLMVPPKMPGFLVEAKILHGPRLVCTPSQALYLDRFHQPPFFLAAVIGFSERLGALYIGHPAQSIAECRYVTRPNRFDSSEWLIVELLGKFYHDERRGLTSPTD